MQQSEKSRERMSTLLTNDYEDPVLSEFKEALDSCNFLHFKNHKKEIRNHFLKGFESGNGSTVFDYLIYNTTENRFKSLQALLSLGIVTPTMRAGGVCEYQHGRTLLEQYAHRKDELGLKIYNLLKEYVVT